MSTTITERQTCILKLTDGYKLNSTQSSPRRESYSECGSPRKLDYEADTKPDIDNDTIHDTIDRLAKLIREPICEIQEKQGVLRTQKYTFIDLVVAMFQHTYNAGVAILTMVVDLLPLLMGIFMLLRFVLDKIIEINNTKDFNEKIFKLIVFIGEVITIFVLISLITSVILIPVVHFVSHSIYKIWGMLSN